MKIRDDMNHMNNEDDDNLKPVTDEDSDKVTKEKGDKDLFGKIIERQFVPG